MLGAAIFNMDYLAKTVFTEKWRSKLLKSMQQYTRLNKVGTPCRPHRL